MLLITAGLHVPVIPFIAVDGKVGAVVPAQKALILLNFGMIMGFDKINPVLRLVVQPLISNSKSEYIPAFNPERTICPEPSATKLFGPTGLPSSVYDIEYVAPGVNPLIVMKPSEPLHVVGLALASAGVCMEKEAL
jgi:hypothetical protein